MSGKTQKVRKTLQENSLRTLFMVISLFHPAQLFRTWLILIPAKINYKADKQPTLHQGQPRKDLRCFKKTAQMFQGNKAVNTKSGPRSWSIKFLTPR